jgi:hypothetical protein
VSGIKTLCIRLPILPYHLIDPPLPERLHQYSSSLQLNSTIPNYHQTLNMPTRRTAAPRTTRTTRAKPSLKTRILGPKRTTRPATTTTTTTTTRTTRSSGHHAAAAPVHHHKRHATMGDKVSGALMKLKGSILHRSGIKVSLT